MKLELLELNGAHTWKSNLNFNITAITKLIKSIKILKKVPFLKLQ